MSIDVVVMGIITRHDEILVTPSQHEQWFEPLWAPAKPMISLQQSLQIAAQSVFKSQLAEFRPLGWLEDLREKSAVHRVIAVFGCQFRDKQVYQQPVIESYGWVPIWRFVDGEAHLYPPGLMDLLQA